ncbi:MAG: hypothetical protein ABII82_09355 [Verrucomicrobiota bacterium]
MKTTIFPYELHVSGGGFCVVLELSEDNALALPLTALVCARLAGREDAQRLVLEFPGHHVTVEGGGLDDMLGHLLAGRVKTLRVGKHEDCVITRIHTVEK